MLRRSFLKFIGLGAAASTVPAAAAVAAGPAPSGGALDLAITACRGQVLPIRGHEALFALLGEKSAVGRFLFQLPDYRPAGLEFWVVTRSNSVRLPTGTVLPLVKGADPGPAFNHILSHAPADAETAA